MLAEVVLVASTTNYGPRVTDYDYTSLRRHSPVVLMRRRTNMGMPEPTVLCADKNPPRAIAIEWAIDSPNQVPSGSKSERSDPTDSPISVAYSEPAARSIK